MRRERVEPGPGQESVWDYPRPPRLEPTDTRIRVVIGEITVADTTKAVRVLETSHPPVYYLPPRDLRMDLLQRSRHGSFCEWKGHAFYYSFTTPSRQILDVAWCYPTPTQRFESIAGFLAFYPGKVDAAYVNDERVQAQESNFYGGWITSNIVGPFKGGPNTFGW